MLQHIIEGGSKMITTKMEQRVKLLKKMDGYLRRNIQDEDVFYGLWLSEGVPDGADDYDYEYIAGDDDAFNECLELFIECCLLDEEGR